VAAAKKIVLVLSEKTLSFIEVRKEFFDKFVLLFACTRYKK
jgi:hypothetical protein